MGGVYFWDYLICSNVQGKLSQIQKSMNPKQILLEPGSDSLPKDGHMTQDREKAFSMCSKSKADYV